MTVHRRLTSRSACVAGLSNSKLIDAFSTTYDVRGQRGDAPDVMNRLEVLHEEIIRREAAGLLTEDDWKESPAPAEGAPWA
jgi:hypothetical protein